MIQEVGTVYITTNLINGKQYVGQTSRNLKKRRWEHEKGIGKNRNVILHSAIKKYGIENFLWIPIKYPISELGEQEQFWIKKLNTISPSGYNRNEGGYSGNYGYKNSFGKRQQNFIGVNNPNYGNYWDEKKRGALGKRKKELQLHRGEKNGRSKLTEEQVKIIYFSIEKIKILAQNYKVGITTIINIKKQKTWKYLWGEH